MNTTFTEGHFARKQILSRSWLISWSHRRRFEVALKLARPLMGRRVLDVGCGDGTFLGMLMASATPPAEAVGSEVDPDVVNSARARFSEAPNLTFVRTEEMSDPRHKERYDGVFCMEVLEHIADLEPILASFQEWLAPDGVLIISVPVEIGPPLLVKQMARTIAGWRGIGDYPGTSPYTWPELWASLTAKDNQHITRPVHRQADGTPFHDHKGFNWRLLRKRLGERFELERIVGSPLGLFPTLLASQIWFVARRRKTSPIH